MKFCASPNTKKTLVDGLDVREVLCSFGNKARISSTTRGGGLGSRPKKMYGERLGDGVEYHLMSPTPRC